jgi:hypothetical protein
MASSSSLPPKKQRFYDSATEEMELPPQNQQQKPNNRSNNTCTTPNHSLVSSLQQTPERGSAHAFKYPYFVVGGETFIRILSAHTLWWENKGQIKLCASVDALDF